MFLISGLLHVSLLFLFGATGGKWEIMIWLGVQPFVIFFEDTVQAMWGGCQSKWWTRTIGYLCVFGFLFWAVPKIWL